MIHVFHADKDLQYLMSETENERGLVSLVMSNLAKYQLATSVKHSELDIAFAATGGPSAWVNVDNMSVDYNPPPERASLYGDVLVELASGFVNLSTPAGFIPLVDVLERDAALVRLQLN